MLFAVISVLLLSSILVVHASVTCPECSSSDTDTLSEIISESEPIWSSDSPQWVDSPLRCNYCAKMGDGFYLYEGYTLVYECIYDYCYECGNEFNRTYRYVEKPAGMIEWSCPHCGRMNH